MEWPADDNQPRGSLEDGRKSERGLEFLWYLSKISETDDPSK